MPAEDRFWTKHGWDFEETFAPHGLGPHRETTALIVRESRAFAIVKLEENSVLLDQELNDVSLLSIEPARGRRDEQVEWREDSVHAGDGIQFAAAQRRSESTRKRRPERQLRIATN